MAKAILSDTSLELRDGSDVVQTKIDFETGQETKKKVVIDAGGDSVTPGGTQDATTSDVGLFTQNPNARLDRIVDTSGDITGSAGTVLSLPGAVLGTAGVARAALEAAAPPVGSTYMQFPNKSDPSTLWPNTTWSNISSETLLRGRVPRIEGTVPSGGGNAAAAFGSSQDDQMQVITGLMPLLSRNNNGGGANSTPWSDATPSGAFSASAQNSTSRSSSIAASSVSNVGSDVNFSSANSSGARTGNATRDASVTVRIWQRTA